VSALQEQVSEWYALHARDLPWRRTDASPWSVMVSEYMLQQTPVSRVLPVYESWMRRWPAPSDLAASPVGEAVRAWGRLGYPRRALRLHGAATAIVREHGGTVPDDLAALRALPGVGDYTAAAIASFAFGQRHVVLDTNVRRVVARACTGVAFAPTTIRSSERELARSLLPEDASKAARWAVASMELGALVCTATAPRCGVCPIAAACAWRLAGRPAYDGPKRRDQAWAGSDRQCRGRLMAVLRETPGPVARTALEAAWPEPTQRERCLDGLVADGLVEPRAEAFALPGHR
jgi:A/G-specific adenine glycosylase